MSYRNDLDALTARKAALEEEVRARSRELDDARRLVAEVEARARLPVLDNLRVAAPCSASWDAMAGDDRVRACGDCNKNVYNLSDMMRDEAEALIREKEGKLCVRYFQRADGTILLKDCTIGIAKKRRRKLVAAGAAVLLAGGAGALLYRSHVKANEPQPLMGLVALPEVSTQGAPTAAHETAPPPEYTAVMGDFSY